MAKPQRRFITSFTKPPMAGDLLDHGTQQFSSFCTSALTILFSPFIKHSELILQPLNLSLFQPFRLLRLKRQPCPIKDLVRQECQRQRLEQRTPMCAVEVAVGKGVGVVIRITGQWMWWVLAEGSGDA